MPAGPDHKPSTTDKSRIAEEPTRQTAKPRSGLPRWFARCFYALGEEGPPKQITCLGHAYNLEKVLKYDFVAGTGLYQAADAAAGLPRKLVCKINRRMHFCLIPLGLLGRLITHSEVSNLRRCQDVRGVPKVLARLGTHMYVYEYIEGRSLSGKPPLPANFFDDLAAVARQMHERNLIHFDLHKRGNILLGDDGRAYIIDFQISRHMGDRVLLSKWLTTRVRQRLQA